MPLTHHRSIRPLALLSLCAIASTGTARSQTFFAGTEHYYEFVPASNMTWQTAKASAEARVYAGVHGHLVTIGDSAENAFVTSLASYGGFVGAWICATSTPANDWQWSSGPEAGTWFWQGGVAVGGAFVPWNPGEPNNAPGFAFLGIGSVGNGNWFDDNDGVPSPSDPVAGYIVEYELRPTTPMQWGENFYQFVWRPHMTWQGAMNTAAAATYQGVTGHLATITTPGENVFVAGVAANSGIDRSLVLGSWMAAQIDGSGTASWVAGPESGTPFSTGQTPIGGSYVQWGGAEPNAVNSVGWISIAANTGYVGFTFGNWLDDDDGQPSPADPIVGFVIEYEQVPCRWQAQPIGFAGTLQEVRVRPSGEIVGLSSGTVQLWNGVSWSVIGTASGSVRSLVVLSNGDVVVSGAFTSMNGVASNGMVRWDGATWSDMGMPTSGSALFALPNGGLLASANPGVIGSAVAQWTNGSWSPVGALSTVPQHLGATADGRILAVIAVPVLSWQVLSWDGTNWSPLGPPAQSVSLLDHMVLSTTPTERPVFGFRDVVYEWRDTSWVSLGHLVGSSGPSQSSALSGLSDGSLLVAGTFGFGDALPTANIGRLSASGEWLSFGGGTDGAVLSVAVDPQGNVVVAGIFNAIVGQPSHAIARFTRTCPASAQSFAPGCPSSGGNNVLTATTLPWVDGTLRTQATGLPTVAIVLTVTGVTSVVPGFPLSAVFVEAPVGCDLAVSLDILGALVTTNGTAEMQLPLPNVPPLVGVTFYNQMVAFEPAATGGFAAITVTNGLQLTAGMF